MSMILRLIINIFCLSKKEPVCRESREDRERVYRECRECKRKIRIEDIIYFGMDRKFCSEDCRNSFMVNLKKNCIYK